jgi:hypothetical protein
VIQTLAGFLGRQPGTARFRMYVPHKVWFGYRWVGNPINTWAGFSWQTTRNCKVQNVWAT